MSDGAEIESGGGGGGGVGGGPPPVTVTVNEAGGVEFPCASVAEHVTVCDPTVN